MGDSQAAAQGNGPDTTPARIQMMGEVLASMGVSDYDPKVSALHIGDSYRFSCQACIYAFDIGGTQRLLPNIL
jgi:hypothetical protein